VNDEDLQTRAAAYAIGALEPSETSAFEALMAERADVRALVRELQEVSALLAAGTPAATPRAELKDRVLAAARADAPRRLALVPRRRVLPAAGLAWAAAIAGLLVAGAQTVRLQRRAEDLRAISRALNSVSQRRDVLEERLAAILDGHTTMSVMQPTGAAAGPRYGGQVFWRADQQTWLVHVFDLPKLPAGSVYQLWYVTADAKISAGVFDVDSTGHGIALLHLPPEARTAAVAAMSVEPGPNGSPQPTGPIVIAGSVRSE
jgi:anti-sigma-K factor RskA